MRRKGLHIIPLTLALLGFGLLQQSGNPATTYHDSLGFSLLPGANSSPVSYYIVRKFDDPARQISAQNISKGSFMAIGTGMGGDNTANPNNEDLFSKYEIAHCGYTSDTIIHHIFYKGSFGCSPLDDLWKLAHKDYPFAPAPSNVQSQGNPQNVSNPTGPGPGWAHNQDSPSDGQIKILQSYGAVFFIDIIYGENAFHLLHDMQDPTWVSNYSGS